MRLFPISVKYIQREQFLDTFPIWRSVCLLNQSNSYRASHRTLEQTRAAEAVQVIPYKWLNKLGQRCDEWLAWRNGGPMPSWRPEAKKGDV